ncbi:thioesterase II family protein [Hyphomicrobium sp.]|uniref:thioesterase II family protein n=1 Tax=Hyphomicrobium sp. TaxID=82 RepID=UPI003F714ED2
MTSPWLIAHQRPSARLTLYCIPHAGRGASLFFPWRAVMPGWIELRAVQLPGREGRRTEQPIPRIATIADCLAREILRLTDRPYAFFGHSMGALIAFETARNLRRLGAPAPRALLLSGRRAPAVPEQDTPIHTLSDADFVDAMCARYNGIPQIILEQPDMMRMLLPIMRADIEAIETYTYRHEPPLAAPFFIYGGRDDPQMTPDNIAGWLPLTEQPHAPKLFSGGHFYLQDERDALIGALAADLSAIAASPHDASAADQRGLGLGPISADADAGGVIGFRR